MAGIYIPSRELYAPELLLPGRSDVFSSSPHGDLEIAPKCLFKRAMLFQSHATEFDLSGGQLTENETAANLISYNTEKCIEFAFGDASSANLEFEDSGSLLDTDCTVLVVLQIPSSFGSWGKYFFGDGSTNSPEDPKFSLGFADATTFRFYCNNNVAIDVTIPTLTSGEWVSVAAKRHNGGGTGTKTYSVSMNGGPIYSTTDNTAVPSTTNNCSIGAWGTYTGYGNLDWNGPIKFCAIADTDVTDSMLRCLSENPYKILQPRAPEFTIESAAAAETTDVFFDNRIDEISHGSRIQTAAKLGGVLVE